MTKKYVNLNNILGIIENEFNYTKMYKAICDLTTEDVKEIQHGFWILITQPDGTPYCYNCSVCNNNTPYVETLTMYNYCPNCGAKMDMKLKNIELK